MNKQTAETILRKKVKIQGGVPTFFDNLIYDVSIKEENEPHSTNLLNFRLLTV